MDQRIENAQKIVRRLEELDASGRALATRLDSLSEAAMEERQKLTWTEPRELTEDACERVRSSVRPHGAVKTAGLAYLERDEPHGFGMAIAVASKALVGNLSQLRKN